MRSDFEKTQGKTQLRCLACYVCSCPGGGGGGGGGVEKTQNIIKMLHPCLRSVSRASDISLCNSVCMAMAMAGCYV